MGKLVRDRIPEIIRQAGGSPEVTVLAPEDLFTALMDKLLEEAQELRGADASSRVEEMADVMEVTQALLAYFDREQVAQVQSQKYLERGGFEKGYLLA